MEQKKKRNMRLAFKPDLSKLDERQLAAHSKQICVVCLKNKGRLAAKLFCEPCEKLVTAEKTRTKYGATKTRGGFESIRDQFIDMVVPLIKARKTAAEVAAVVGVSQMALRNRLSRLRAHGFDIPNMWRPGGRKPKPAEQPLDTGKARNGHGGGKWGVKRCRCQPCLDVRKMSRHKWRQEKLRQQRRAQREAANAAKAAKAAVKAARR